MSKATNKDRAKNPKDHLPWAEVTVILGGSSSGIVFGVLGISALGAGLTAHGLGLIGSGLLCALIPMGGVLWRRVKD